MSRIVTTVAKIVPKKLRREFKTRGGDARFLMWVSFLVSFVWARTYLLYFGHHTPNLTYRGEFTVGSQTVLAGYHPHHIFWGFVLLALAGWMAIYYGGKQLTRLVAIMYGIGLGLIVDEIGFLIEGFTYLDDFPEVFVIFVVIGGLMMSSIYFPQFWQSLEVPFKWLWAWRLRGRRTGRAPPAADSQSIARASPEQTPDEPPRR